ncbi:hypothetical protein I7I48_00822 [Histoplasma ohiense]|nr:hypothetical protein I7I48_00822 [Histoplasma ohiense (nom. inval.)]
MHRFKDRTESLTKRLEFMSKDQQATKPSAGDNGSPCLESLQFHHPPPSNIRDSTLIIYLTTSLYQTSRSTHR